MKWSSQPLCQKFYFVDSLTQNWEVFKASATKHQLTDNKKLMLGIVIKLSYLKNFNKTYSTWLIVVLYILKIP